MVERLSLPATVDALGEVARFVGELGAAAGLPADRAYKLRLAAEEIATNIVTHGYAEPGAGSNGAGPPRFVVEGAADGGRVWIRLVDTAPRFDPTATGDPVDLDRPLAERQVGGLGIYLVRSVLDDFRYEHADGENRTTLVIERAPRRAETGDSR